MTLEWSTRFQKVKDKTCLIQGLEGNSFSYQQLIEYIRFWKNLLTENGVTGQSVVAFPGRYNASNVSLLLAVSEIGGVAVPLPGDGEDRIERLLEIAQVTHWVAKQDFEGGSFPVVNLIQRPVSGTRHPLYEKLTAEGHGGLVLFTSGTTGDPKAAVQDIDRLILRYEQPRNVDKMLAFMQIDHIGGINTLFYVLCNGGTLVVPASRSPDDVAATIARNRIEVLPVSPTFLNLLLITGAIDRHDLTSLRRITYGSESMPQSVLDKVAEKLPGIELLQTYGTTELGILKSKSENNQSLWMKLGGEGYETKIVDGRLWVRAQTSMLGYLNAPSPFDEEGFMDTNDEVEVRGEWMRILGRKSDFINVGGTKVSPVEVESVILEMPCVKEIAVRGTPHPIIGQVVEAVITLNEEMDAIAFKAQMRKHCAGRLPNEAIPAKITIASGQLVTDRFKRDRRS